MAIDDMGSGADLDGALEFIESSHLSYMIPNTTNLDLEDVSQDAEDTGSLFDTIEQRESLYFDETVDVHLILRTPLLDVTALRSYLSRLQISVEAQVVNGHAPDRDSPPASDVIFEGVVEDTDDPFIVVDAAEESDNDSSEEQSQSQSQPQQQHIYAVWKLPVFLSRPRIRLQEPTVVFRASANLKPADPSTNVGDALGYMRSGVPAGLNLLESFGADPSLGGITPRLSALRVSRVAPVTQSRGMMKPIRAQPSLELKVFPAIHTRVRFSRPNTAPTSAALVAMLEVDFSSHFDCDIALDKITLGVLDGTIENLNNQAGLALPMKCRPHDHVTFLYRIAPQQIEMMTKNPTRDLDITIEATVEETPGVCTPKLTLAWSTTLDFTLPVNPGFGAAMQPIQRAHRPSQLSIGGSEATQSLTAPAVSRPDALPGLEAATTRSNETTIPDLGLTLTFCAPKGPLRLGEPFSWTVYVVNRTGGSDKAPPAAGRKLALVALPKRRRNDVRAIRPPSTSGKGKTAADGRKVADAVLDENVVHAMQRNSLVDSTEVVCLSADTRVGPLAPGACHVAELRFVAMRTGIVGVDAIRVVDLNTQEHVDVRDLPIIVVEEEGESDSKSESKPELEQAM